MLRLLNKRINNNLLSLAKNSQLIKLQIKNFSGGHHSGSDHSDHSHHSDHSDHGHGNDTVFPVNPPLEDYEAQVRARTFGIKAEIFSVDKLLDSIKKPIIKADKPDHSNLSLFKTNKEYIDFLADTFKSKALEKYPNYRNDLSLSKNVPNFENLNKYQQEVYLLQAFLVNEMEKQKEEVRKLYSFESNNSLEDTKKRNEFFHSNLILH
jgi:hypothetical protein